ncbi:MAG: hypothetical protein IT580_10615 [Verrucomicrobiales bacterium]|nr:hypothetical protein [Verrucomicrobiales bacterium]
MSRMAASRNPVSTGRAASGSSSGPVCGGASLGPRRRAGRGAEPGTRPGAGSWGWRHVGGAVLVLAAFGAGMVVQDLRDLNPKDNLDRSVPPVEEFLSWDSFSEVEQTRALLRALCLRSIAEIRVGYLERRGNSAPEAVDHAQRVEQGLAAAIRETRDQIAEFEGTAEEWLLHGEMLRLLQRAERSEEWLDAYLDLVQRNPTDSLIENLELRAREVACRLGREAELEPVLAHWSQLPWNRSRKLLSQESPGTIAVRANVAAGSATP